MGNITINQVWEIFSNTEQNPKAFGFAWKTFVSRSCMNDSCEKYCKMLQTSRFEGSRFKRSIATCSPSRIRLDHSSSKHFRLNATKKKTIFMMMAKFAKDAVCFFIFYFATWPRTFGKKMYYLRMKWRCMMMVFFVTRWNTRLWRRERTRSGCSWVLVAMQRCSLSFFFWASGCQVLCTRG